MADLIKKIKIKKQDGTFTDYIPIGADAVNVSTEDGDSVQLKINKKPYYYNNIADMKADTKLKAGDMAITLGYYEPNDGGGAKYRIVIDNSLVEDGGSVHTLSNGLKADLQIDSSEIINFRVFGVLPNQRNQDCHNAMLIYLSLLKRYKRRFTLYIPIGIWYFSETDLFNGNDVREGVKIIGCSAGDYNKSTKISPFENNQKYIWNIGVAYEGGIIVGDNDIQNFFFSTIPNDVKFCETALLLTCCCYSHFDNLMFGGFRGSAITIQTGFENYFGTLHFRGVGYVTKDKVYNGFCGKRNPTYNPGSAISAMYINYIDVEGITGSVFYFPADCAANHNEINNMQIEWTFSNFGRNQPKAYSEDLIWEEMPYSQDSLEWNDLNPNINHCFVVKGNVGSNYDPLIINNITCSWSNPKTYKYSYTDENNQTVEKYLRYSGIIGADDVGMSSFGPNCIIGNIHSRGNGGVTGEIPAYYNISGDHTGEHIQITNLNKGLIPFQTIKSKARNLSCLSFPSSFAGNQYSSSFYTRENASNFKILTRENKEVYVNWGELDLTYDANSYNIDKLFIDDGNWTFVNLDGSNYSYKLRMMIKTDKSIDELPTSGNWYRVFNIHFPDGSVINKNLEIKYADIHNGTYPINEWFEIDLNKWIPYGSCQLEIRYTAIDCIIEVPKKTSIANQLNSNIYKKSKIGAQAWCTDRRKTESDSLGILLIWDDTNWKTLDDGTTLDNLVE